MTMKTEQNQTISLIADIESPIPNQGFVKYISECITRISAAQPLRKFDFVDVAF